MSQPTIYQGDVKITTSVDPITYGPGNLQVDNNLLVQGSESNHQVDDFLTSDNIIGINEPPPAPGRDTGFLASRHIDDIVAGTPAETGTAQGGGAFTIILDLLASVVPNFYNDWVITITAGPGIGEIKTITTYSGPSYIATVDTAWVTPPTNASTYTLFSKLRVGLVYDESGDQMNMIGTTDDHTVLTPKITSYLDLRVKELEATSVSLIQGLNSVMLQADPALASSYTYNFPAAPPTGDGQVMVTSGPSNVFFNLSPKNRLVVRKDPGPGEFLTLVGAIASLPIVGPSMPSVSNPYAIHVYPGYYLETAIIVPSYVYVVGESMEGVTFEPAAMGYSLFKMSSNSGLAFAGVANSDPAFPCFDCDNCGDFVILHKVTVQSSCQRFLSCVTDGTATSDSVMYLEYVDTTDALIYTLNVRDTNILGGFGSVVTIENFFTFGHNDDSIILNGLNTSLFSHASELMGDGTGNCVHVGGGARAAIRGMAISNYSNGIFVDNDGIQSHVHVTGLIYANCTVNINITNTLTHGNSTGYTEYLKTIVPKTAPFFITNKDQHIITVASKGADFTSVAAAVNAITDNSPINRYTIYIGPGIYVEPQIVMKSYVTLLGFFQTQSILVAHPSVAGIPFIIGSGYAAVDKLTLTVASYAFPPSYLVEFLGDPSGVHFRVDNVVFDSSANYIHVGSTDGPTIFLLINPLFNMSAPFINGVYVEDSGPFNYPITFAIDNLIWGSDAIGVSAVNEVIRVTSFKSPSFFIPNIFGAITNCSLGTNFYGPAGKGFVFEGAIYAAVETCLFGGMSTGVEVLPSAESTFLLMTSSTISNNIKDIDIQSATALGSINVNATRTKTFINASANFGVVIADPTGQVTFGGDIYQGASWNRVTQISDQLHHACVIGSLDGQVLITPIGGLNISVGTVMGGYVFIGPPGDNYMWKLDWSAVPSMTLPDNTISWIYVDVNNNVLNSTSEPSPIQNVVLGTVNTYGGQVTYIQQIGRVVNNLTTNIDTVLRDIFGNIVQGGCIASPGSSLVERAAAVSSGTYALSSIIYHPVSGDNVSMIGYYGGTLETAPFTNIPLSYDNAGVITPLVAGQWVKHAIYILAALDNTVQYFFVYAQQTYASELLAQEAGMPIPPSTFLGNMCNVCGVIVTFGDPSSPLAPTRFRDTRPTLAFHAEGFSAQTSHHSLSDLTTGDDHPQYFRTDGTRVMAGNIQLGTFNVIGAGGNLFNGVDPTAHAFRHLPGGADALTTLPPVSIGSANALGIAAAFARSDHIHAGVSSIKANAGTAELGAIVLLNGTNVNIVDSPAGTFTINVPNGAGGVTTWSAGTTGFTPSSATTGAVTMAGTLNATNGGTGLTVYAVGDILYANTTTSLTRLADVVTGNALISGGVGVAPAWGKIGLTSHVTGILPIANGGTNSGTSLNNNRIMVSSGGAIVEASALTDGQLLIGSTGAAPVAATITAGTGISVTNGTGSITVANTGVLSVQANGGASETGIINLVQGTNITVTDSPAGTFTFDVPAGAGGVISWSAGTTGLTPAVATTGVVTLAGTLIAVNGGTGFSSYTIGDMLYADTATTLTKLADVAAGSYLRSGGVATAPLWSTLILPNAATTGDLFYATAGNTMGNLADVATGNALISGGVGVVPTWGKIGLTTHVSGILPIANGGTNSSAALNNNRIMVSSGGSIVEAAALLDGQLLVGATGGAPVATSITAGTGISVTNGAGSITIANTGVTSWSAGTTGLTPNSATTGAVTLAGTLIAVNGGTGFSSYTIGDMLYADTATTLAKLADVAAGRYLRSGGVATAPLWSTLILPNAATTGDLLYAAASNTIGNLADVATGNALISGGVGVAPTWGKIGLTTHVSGILPIANGGTNSGTSLNNNRIMVSSGGAIVEAAALTNGQLLIGSTGAAPVAASITAGTGISVTNGAGTITIANTGVISWSAGTTGLTPSTATTGAVTLAGTLIAVNGGTGFSSYTIGDILYANTTTTLAKLADVAVGSYLRSGGVGVAPLWSTLTLPNAATTGDLLYATASNTIGNLADVATGNALISGGVGVAPTWGKIGLTTHVTGVLPIANGGTNSSAALNNNRIMVSSGGAIVEAAALTNGQLLIGSTGAAPVAATITAGTAITVTNGAGTITIANAGVISWSAGTTGLTPSTATTGAVTLAGTLIAVNGGTGFSSYAIGDLLYANTTTTLAKLADVATGNALISGGVGVAPSWGKIGLTTHVTGILPIANGGTNSGTALSNNRIIVSSGGAIVEAAALTDGQLLIGSTGAAPVATSITAGTGISVTNGAGSITIANTGVTSWSAGTTGLTPSSATTGAVTLAGTLIAINGGTGISSYTVGDLLYANTTTTLAKLADVATGNALISGGVGVAPSWGKIGLTTHVTGVLPIANGGTNTSAALNNNRIMVSSGGAIVEAAALTNGQLLIGSTGAAPVASTVTAGTGITVTNGAGSITIAANSAATPQIVTITTNDDSIGGGTNTLAYFPWKDSRYSSYTTRTVTMWVIPSSGAGKDLTVDVLPNGGASLGSLVILGGSAVGAIYTFTINNPGADTRLDFIASRTGGGGSNPRVQGITLDLS